MVIKTLNLDNSDSITKFLLSEDSFTIRDIASSKKIINDVNSLLKKHLTHKENNETFVYALFDDEEIKLAVILDNNGKFLNFTPSQNLTVAEGRAFMREFSKLFKNKGFEYFTIESKESRLNFLNNIGFKSSKFIQKNDINESNYYYFFVLKYYLN